MLSIKDINEVSFRKSNFSGYNSDDVDQFIDEVLETVTALAKENAEAKSRTADTSSKIAELTAKNTELQEKLSILAAKIESYREDEDGIKEALLSAQRLGSASIRDAKAKAESILAEANAKAEAMLADARIKSQKMVETYKEQIEKEKKNLDTTKREVTAFRASLYALYREHINLIDRIPEYDVPETPAVQPAPVAEKPVPAAKPKQEEEQIPVPAAQIEEKPAPAPAVKAQPVVPVQPAAPAATPVYDKNAYIQEQFNGIGLDLNAYSDIPETLQKEKESLFSTLEFGMEDTSKKKGKFKRR